MTDNTPPVGASAVSTALARARRRADALPGPPPGLPEDLEGAYRIQRMSIDAWPDDVAGWKVGGVPPSYSERYGETRLAGPIFAQSVVHADQGRAVEMPVFEGGFAAIEPEFIFQLGETRDEDRLFIGAEIASSPIPAINDHGPVAVICDFGNNNGLLIGPEISDWRHRHEPVTVRTVIENEEVATKVVDDFPVEALAALDFLLDLAARRGFNLPSGTYVSSGAITGVHEAQVGARSHLDFGALGALQLELVAAKPSA